MRRPSRTGFSLSHFTQDRELKPDTLKPVLLKARKQFQCVFAIDGAFDLG
jgi:hypothetical protein